MELKLNLEKQVSCVCDHETFYYFYSNILINFEHHLILTNSGLQLKYKVVHVQSKCWKLFLVTYNKNQECNNRLIHTAHAYDPRASAKQLVW